MERFDFIGALVAGSGFVEDGRIQGKPDVMYFTVNTVNKNSVVLFFWIFLVVCKKVHCSNKMINYQLGRDIFYS